MNEEEVSWVARGLFGPFLSDLGFKLADLRVSGMSALAKFRSSAREVWISLDPATSSVSVHVFTGTGASISDIDDLAKTPRLRELNGQFMEQVSREERIANSAYFEERIQGRSVPRAIMRCASDLRLVLPKYLSRG